MILAGWGRGARAIAYLGIGKCQGCRNWDHFQLFETQRRVTLYFVPVAKFATHYYAVCNCCQAAVELSKAEADVLLRDSVAVPSPDDAEVIWQSLMEAACDESLETPEQGFAVLEARAKELKTRYSDDHVEQVLSAFVGYVTDEDRPR